MRHVREWTRGDTAGFLRAPGPQDDKYSRGVVGLRTGSAAYPGAAVLGVEAAWRSGAGFVRYIGTGPAAAAVLSRRPETVVSERMDGARADAWVIGSGADGATRSAEEEQELRQLLAGRAPVVVDAGALDLLTLPEDTPSPRAPLLLTPHAREFARVLRRLGLSADDDADRAGSAARLAAALDAVVLLKGAQTLIAAPDGTVIQVSAGTGWLATAGTGDVLGGVLGALLAANHGAAVNEVAAAGAWLHGQAGRRAAGVGTGGSAHGHPIVALDVAESLLLTIADLLS